MALEDAVRLAVSRSTGVDAHLSQLADAMGLMRNRRVTKATALAIAIELVATRYRHEASDLLASKPKGFNTRWEEKPCHSEYK